MIGARVGIMVGVRVGAIVGAEGGQAITWSVDETSGIAVPATAQEMSDLLSAAGISGATVEALYLFGAPASGNVSDSSGNSKTLTASGTLTYQQSPSGWASKSLRTTEGVLGFVSNASFPDVNANDCTVMLWAGVTGTPSNFRALMHFGGSFDDSVCFELNTTPRALLGRGDGSGRTVGTFNPTGSVRPWILTSDAGVDAIGYTNQETISGSPSNGANGTELKFGGDNADSWFPAATDYVWACRISKALSPSEVASLLTASGW